MGTARTRQWRGLNSPKKNNVPKKISSFFARFSRGQKLQPIKNALFGAIIRAKYNTYGVDSSSGTH